MLPLFAVDSDVNFVISITGVGLLIPIIGRLLKLRDEHLELLRDMKQIKTQTETMWNAHMSRGRVEGEKSGHMVFSNPTRSISHDSFRLSLDAHNRFQEITPALHKLADAMPNADDKTLAMIIEKQLGSWIVDKVCRPLGLDNFSCLVMAVAIARNRDSVVVYPPMSSPSGSESNE